MRPRSLLALVALTAFAILFGQPVPASASHNAPRTFVSTTGNDANPCSAAAPCRTFAVAIGHTAAGGEVLAIDSGGYGPVTITQSVSIVGAPGAHVAITVSAFNSAVTVNAGPTDRVVLRNLYLSGLGGGSYGVNFSSGAVLHVENSVVEGFTNLGTAAIVVHAPDSETFISDSTLRNNSDGVTVDSFSGIATAVITRVLALNNTWDGFIAFGGSRVLVRDSVASGSFYGCTTVSNDGTLAQMSIENSTFSGNTNVGIRVGGGTGPSVVDVSNSTITYNGVGVSEEADGTASSRGNNTLFRNGTNGTFSGSIPPQ